MPELFVFLIKVNIALVLFCAGYYLVLRKLTFYALNRAYLIMAIIFSSVYPFVDLSAFAQRHREIVVPVQNVVINWQAPAQQFVQRAAYWNWLEGLFWTGAIILATRLISQLFSLYLIYRRSVGREINGQKVRVVNADIGPFSFWKSIYINPDKLNPVDLQNILQHEQIHVNEWHTLDILLAEISVIFYWFNPGIWLMKKAVRENIEFITDRKILQKGADSKAYQYSLLSITFNQPAPVAITNNFNFPTLKKRIKMMNSKRSANINLTRYAFLVPAVVVCLFAFSLSKAEIVKKVKAFAPFKNTVKAFENLQEPKPSATLKKIKLKPVLQVTKADTSVKLDTEIRSFFTMTRSSNNTYTLNGQPVTEDYAKGFDADAFAKVQKTTMTMTDTVTKKVLISLGSTFGLVKNQQQLKKLNDLSKDDKIQIVNDAAGVSKIQRGISYFSRVDKALLKKFSDKLIVINGKISSESELDNTPLESIKSVSVQTGPTAVEQYGLKADKGVLYVGIKQ